MHHAPRDPHLDRCVILRHCPGWQVKWASVQQSWEAFSPNYESDGIVVRGRNAEQLILRVRSLSA